MKMILGVLFIMVCKVLFILMISIEGFRSNLYVRFVFFCVGIGRNWIIGKNIWKVILFYYGKKYLNYYNGLN